jgi:dTDP-4-amino-4,6-dideoxygalactose transaminase
MHPLTDEPDPPIELAANGGPRAVEVPPPHFSWPPRDDATRAELLREYDGGELSYMAGQRPVDEFERAFAAYHGRSFGVATSSGTAALFAAYAALGIGPGDEVIAPAYTHHATVTPLLHLGAKVVLCDLDPATGASDPEAVARLISERTKALVVTHVWGQPAAMDRLVQLAAKAGAHVVEDGSQAHGARYRGRLVGSFGTVGCFSCQASKAVPCGEGGVLVTDDPTVYERAVLVVDWGPRVRRRVAVPTLEPLVETGYGLKHRMHPFAATLGAGALRRLDALNARRAAVLARIAAAIEDVPGLAPPPARAGEERAWYRFVIRLEGGTRADTARVVELLRAEGLQARVSAMVPVQRHAITQLDGESAFGALTEASVEAPGGTPEADRFADGAIELPPFSEPSHEELIPAYAAGIRKVWRAVYASGARPTAGR